MTAFDSEHLSGQAVEILILAGDYQIRIPRAFVTGRTRGVGNPALGIENPPTSYVLETDGEVAVGRPSMAPLDPTTAEPTACDVPRQPVDPWLEFRNAAPPAELLRIEPIAVTFVTRHKIPGSNIQWEREQPFENSVSGEDRGEAQAHAEQVDLGGQPASLLAELIPILGIAAEDIHAGDLIEIDLGTGTARVAADEPDEAATIHATSET